MKHTLKNKTTLLIIGALAIAGVVGVALWYYSLSKNESTSSAPTSDSGTTATVEDKPVGEVDYTPTSDSDEAPVIDESPPSSPLPDSTPASQPIPLAISYAGGSPLQVRVVIKEILSSGTCTLTLKKTDGTTMTQSVPTFPASSYTTCQGFTVDDPSIKTGKLVVTVTIKSGSRSGETTTEVLR